MYNPRFSLRQIDSCNSLKFIDESSGSETVQNVRIEIKKVGGTTTNLYVGASQLTTLVPSGQIEFGISANYLYGTEAAAEAESGGNADFSCADGIYTFTYYIEVSNIYQKGEVKSFAIMCDIACCINEKMQTWAESYCDKDCTDFDKNSLFDAYNMLQGIKAAADRDDIENANIIWTALENFCQLEC